MEIFIIMSISPKICHRTILQNEQVGLEHAWQSIVAYRTYSIPSTQVAAVIISNLNFADCQKGSWHNTFNAVV